jgi:hypothetical protein
MKKIASSFVLSVVFLSIAILGVAEADQAAWVSREKAEAAATVLREQDEIKLWCEPCGDLYPLLRAVGVVEARREEDDYWSVCVNGESLDLAYVYVMDGGRWVNLAKKLSIDVDGVSSVLYDEPEGDYVKITVTGTGVNIRTAPGMNAPAFSKAASGDVFAARARATRNEDDGSEWYWITHFEDERGRLRMTGNSPVYGFQSPCVSAKFVRAEPLDARLAEIVRRKEAAIPAHRKGVSPYSAFDWSPEAQRSIALAGLPIWGHPVRGAIIRSSPSETAPPSVSDPAESVWACVTRIAEEGASKWYELTGPSPERYRAIGWARAEEFEREETGRNALGRLSGHMNMMLTTDLDDASEILGPLLSGRVFSYDSADGRYFAREYPGVSLTFIEYEYGDICLNSASFTRPGSGAGGIVCGAEWCDKSYVLKILPMSRDDYDHSIERGDDGSESWTYFDGSYEVMIAFAPDGVVRELRYDVTQD